MWATGWGGRVTTERTRPILGSLGWRLLMAFSLVALGAVALVTAAALVGTGRGIEQAEEVNRELVSARVADAAAAAYRAAGSWAAADLSEAEAIATAAGARIFIVAADGSIVSVASQERPLSSGVGSSSRLIAGLRRVDGTPSPSERSPAPDPGGGGSGQPSSPGGAVPPSVVPSGGTTQPGPTDGGGAGGTGSPSVPPSPSPDGSPGGKPVPRPHLQASPAASGMPRPRSWSMGCPWAWWAWCSRTMR